MLAIFCGTFAFTQEKTANEEKLNEKLSSDAPLYTRFYQVQYLDLYYTSCFPSEKSEKHKNVDKFINLLQKRLSPSGKVEIDSRTMTLIITDESERVELIVYFVKLLDESGFTLEEIVNNPKF